MRVSAGLLRTSVIVGALLLSPCVRAQTGPATSWPKTAFKPNPRLTEPEQRGEHWFLQRCSICHLGSFSKEEAAGFPSKAPSLEGLLKGATAEKEQAVRDQIRKGSANMPGFQYSLEPKDLDELIAYIKTL